MNLPATSAIAAAMAANQVARLRICAVSARVFVDASFTERILDLAWRDGERHSLRGSCLLFSPKAAKVLGPTSEYNRSGIA
jgi:hypothetical protein